MMKVSEFGVKLVAAFEGFSATPYRCPAGVLTQGYGHTAAAGAPALGGSWTKEQARAILERTLEAKYAAPVRAMLKRQPRQCQFDAMVSLAYNIGVGAFERSTVLRRFNAGDMAGAASAFSMWTKAAGKVQRGLVRRRASEALVFTGVMDIDFDGVLDSGEPLYGAMPQRVSIAAKPAVESRTVQGATVAAGGGVALLGEAVQQAQQAQSYWDSGTIFGALLGSVIVAGACWTLYSAWEDRGRPLPWRREEAAPGAEEAE